MECTEDLCCRLERAREDITPQSLLSSVFTVASRWTYNCHWAVETSYHKPQPVGDVGITGRILSLTRFQTFFKYVPTQVEGRPSAVKGKETWGPTLSVFALPPSSLVLAPNVCTHITK